jgi:hypothetical protein
LLASHLEAPAVPLPLLEALELLVVKLKLLKRKRRKKRRRSLTMIWASDCLIKWRTWNIAEQMIGIQKTCFITIDTYQSIWR